MNITLNESELQSLAQTVSQILYKEYVKDGARDALQKASEKYASDMLKWYVSENAVSYDVAKMIKPILDEHIKNSNVIDETLRQFTSTEYFKKLEIRQLENRLRELNRIEEEENEN